MKVTVERAALLRSLGHVHRVVERRNTIPILSNVLLRSGPDGLQLKATDLDIEVTETIPADVVDGGAITVPAHVIYDIVRKLPDGAQVSLETSGETGQMLIRSGRSRFTLGPCRRPISPISPPASCRTPSSCRPPTSSA